MPSRSSLRLDRARRSPAWNGRTFANRLPSPVMQGNGLSTTARFLFERNERRPPGPLPSVPVDPAVLHGPAAGGLRVTWLGHSTSLVEIAGRRVLLDPVWSDRCSPVGFAGPKRF